jgi:hypothetical protein
MSAQNPPPHVVPGRSQLPPSHPLPDPFRPSHHPIGGMTGTIRELSSRRTILIFRSIERRRTQNLGKIVENRPTTRPIASRDSKPRPRAACPKELRAIRITLHRRRSPGLGSRPEVPARLHSFEDEARCGVADRPSPPSNRAIAGDRPQWAFPNFGLWPRSLLDRHGRLSSPESRSIGQPPSYRPTSHDKTNHRREKAPSSLMRS